MARGKRKITFKAEFHASVDAAEAHVNEVVRRLWGDKWPSTPHRTKITGTEIEKCSYSDGDTLYRNVTLYFAELPYASAEARVWNEGQGWHAASWVTFTPNPEFADQEPQLAKGEITVTVEDGQLVVYDRLDWMWHCHCHKL